jgi:hypothetical protein
LTIKIVEIYNSFGLFVQCPKAGVLQFSGCKINFHSKPLFDHVFRLQNPSNFYFKPKSRAVPKSDEE